MPEEKSFKTQTSIFIDSCFSATLSEHLKRDEETSKIMEDQHKPRFVENLVRECHRLFLNADYIEARSLESSQPHDAIAYLFK